MLAARPGDGELQQIERVIVPFFDADLLKEASASTQQ